VAGFVVGLIYVFVADAWRKIRSLILSHVEATEAASAE
jgi:hypothetical protein